MSLTLTVASNFFLPMLNIICIKQGCYLNLSRTIQARICTDSMAPPKEPPVLLKAGAGAWLYISDTGSASDNTRDLFPLLRCQDH